MNYAIITGASRGLGEAIAEQLMDRQVSILSLSRTSNEALKQRAKEKGVSFYHVACDLSEAEDTERAVARASEIVFRPDTDYIYLVNNAGVVEPIETVGQLDPDSVSKHIRINVTAPMVLTNHFLKEANSRSIQMGIINITSGAAEKTIHGWSVYSSSKAALNKFTETLALEQKDRTHTIISFSPGVMDTEMQGDIRSSSKDAFADVEKFKKLKEEGGLRSPEEVAAVLMKLLGDKSIENGKVYRLYDLI
ncbi:(S)-benzoin forming benzil reductase [Bacillus sp. SB49]|uniref:(S)-benzoin forming benzil reductase n=1 Tax=Bacillus sp. SB49 TaxID=1071080 RepID=UPI000402ACC1|nr:(S)-benzoin forming benzil reductase [Bacillus sp. SB49]QHT45924.1 (S)-benzoin forming benzil reductase [Bacillus sp. SB49]